MSVKRKILVVDDEKRNVKLLSAYLIADGFAVLEAFDGEKALELASFHDPDVILLDIMMPEMNGFEVTKKLKSKANTRHIPVVLVTSLDGSDNRVKGLNAGADEFLTKPVNRAELLARVRALQRMKQMQEELQNRRNIVASISSCLVGENLSKRTVLLVEDDELLCKQILSVLNLAHFHTTVVANIAAARKVINSNLPDVILLDRLLPDGEGLMFLAELKSSERFADLPIIIITALNELEQKISGIECGADDYLIKPIEHNELVARIRASIRRSMAIQDLKRDLAQAQKDTVTDQLTGVRNRHYLDADLDYRCAQLSRYPERSFAILMVDIDFFKSINDKYGHLMGDKVIKCVASELQKTGRTADIVTRYGGEEFCVILPETEMNDALSTAERMRESIEQFEYEDAVNLSVTISIGVAVFDADKDNSNGLLVRADDALYSAKKSGRNKVCASL